MSRTMINKYIDDSVSGTDVQAWPTIPNGETWHLDRFGGCAGGAALIALQKNDGSGWKTIRMIACGCPGGHGEYEVNQDFVGDGTLALRLVRQEKSGSAQQIVCWAEGYKMV